MFEFDIPEDAKPAQVYGTVEFERARLARIPVPIRRTIVERQDPPPFRNLREQHAHYMAVRARLNGAKPKVAAEPAPACEPKIEVAPKQEAFIPPAFWSEPCFEPTLPADMDPSRDWLIIDPRPKVEQIIRATALHFGVSRNDIISERRTASIVKPRQVAMYLCKTLTLRSLPDIGRRFGGRDHTTILHGVRKIAGMIEAGDEGVRAAAAAIRMRLGVTDD